MAEKCPEHNADCGSALHKQHLCYFVSQGFHLSNRQEYEWMVANPRFVCRHCGRKAKCQENLCEPERM